MTTIADLTPGTVLSGVRPGLVTVVAATPVGDSLNLVFRDADGNYGDRLLYAADLAIIAVHAPESQWTLDADGDEFRLAAEALRIRMAGIHDPMLAVTTSNIRPLPHQIKAVYEELLPRMPLRFLLADDPGAGKTIMAGLYAKELILRGDLQRMLVIAPGGLVEQWQDELYTKFGIDAELLTRDLAASTKDGNPFTDRHPLLIARMDQLARSEDWCHFLDHSEWDLVVVDEAHRMSANWWAGELRKTRRYDLGQQLGRIARHLLYMTATPHAGSEENFQAFMALLDPDRFEGQYRAGVHSTDTSGLMRRMVKEELRTFDGKALFPERIAETVPYQLSAGEAQLYEAVTNYVRTEMNRADALDDSSRQRTVGFALTVLQRRLASSTHAILRSLERRRERLIAKRTEMLNPVRATGPGDSDYRFTARTIEDFDADELDAEEAEAFEENVVDLATAARTAAELQVENDLLGDLVALARKVRDSRRDTKWEKLRDLLLDQQLLRETDGSPRKLIIFTEHRDTLDYLTAMIRNQVGSDQAVVNIHGGTSRLERRRVREEFTHEPHRQVLVATDAAGEGLNLQAAYLMINYDLPWNPNRIEQRFGRIHRIGQEHVCRLWNLVAEDTREGQVFARLLWKMEQQRAAYGGRLFDVLGEAFTRRALRDLLIDAIRYGDDPARREENERILDTELAEGTAKLVAERALAREAIDPVALDHMRRKMDEARARKLQPHYIRAFFTDAFGQLGGRLAARESQRYQVTHVPAALRSRQRSGTYQPLASSYERVTFEPTATMVDGRAAEFLAPGHPLLDTVIDLMLERHQHALTRGTVLVDPSDTETDPRLVVALLSEIIDGTGRTVSKRFTFVALTPDGTAQSAGPAPYLDASPPTQDVSDIVKSVLAQPWLAPGVEQLATAWAITHDQLQHLGDVEQSVKPILDKTAAEVRRRLTMQINHLDGEAARLHADLEDGRRGRRALRHSPEKLEARARDLELRLARRLTTLSAEKQLAAKQPTLAGAALILPVGLVNPVPGPATTLDTSLVERRAVDAVIAAELALGRQPAEMPRNNPGYDIASTSADGHTVFIEVKGRIVGAPDFHVTKTEVLTGKNAAPHHRLAMVAVHPDGPALDELRYLDSPFTGLDMDFNQTYLGLAWAPLWNKGSSPL
ncbi:RNA helicase [Mycobacterium kubicae]|uniref:RNA helicase n=1 Tax=Mycobacterium kubicae TaxID=120959 RepID=A0ABQ1BW93_9MYCO|nr:helicase-related protein [Mycobacterium kubicae]ORV96452.1 helicase [Mycobacterium kubicae]GFG67907.1 RNA helicase [Mycobacterium kubicae]